MPKVKSVGAVIFRIDDSKERLYLLLKYKAKHWDFVKGQIDVGETEEQTMRREATEETGISDLKIIPGFKEYTKFIFKQYDDLMSEEQRKAGKQIWVFKVVIFFLASTKTEDIKLSWEHQDFKWLPYKQALKQITYKGSKEILQKAEKHLNSLDTDFGRSKIET